MQWEISIGWFLSFGLATCTTNRVPYVCVGQRLWQGIRPTYGGVGQKILPRGTEVLFEEGGGLSTPFSTPQKQEVEKSRGELPLKLKFTEANENTSNVMSNVCNKWL